MEVDLWNRISIPRPGAISTTHIPFNKYTDSEVTHLLKASETVLKLLRSKVLQTEVRVLYALLYVLNNSLRQHLPFRAIKQVEQCINRLKDMKLESVLQDLKEMCPTKVQRLVGKRTGQCEVPSQPTLEWMCLKVLGACKLMICMAERCSRAFQLAGQHLHWREFIVLNLVLMSMLSRLWAFSNGIIRTLAPVYEKMMVLLQEVSQAKPMPFLSDFILPTDLEAFLGPVAKLKGDLCGAKGMRRPSMLNRLFTEEGRNRKRKQACLHRKSSRGSDRVDLGSVVSQSRAEVTDHLGGFDLKSMLKRPYGKNNQFVFGRLTPCELNIPKTKSTSQKLAVIGQKKSFLKKLKTMSSLSDMGAHLQEMIDWFRSRKMRRESSCLRLLQLKCLRLKRLEAQGLRVNRKLQSLRGEMGRALYPGEARRTEHFLFLQRYRTRHCHSLHRQWRRLHCRALFSSNRKRSYKCSRRGGPSQTLAGGGLSPEEGTGGGGGVTNEDTARDEKSHGMHACTSGQDDIDDIFASIGF
ncbi:nucleolus and neural progenitor protein isoform X1 [Anguilla rostrata]|uniref:nucleolus and neural progenitor protein isoform X1 n=1 Tax=Anguilla rostrata TaxID=7938 RepID=UPI0030CC7524